MLKTTASSTLARSVRTRIDKNELDIDGGSSISDDRINDRIKNLSKSTKVKKSLETDFLTFRAKKAFSYIQKAFIKALIFRDFDLKCHIQIKTDTSGYAIVGVLSQMVLD